MPGYEALLISEHCNVDASILGDASLQGRSEAMPSGNHTYHGLPFIIGDGQGRVAGFGDGVRLEAVTIPIPARATHVIFAHRLLGSKILEGGTPVGIACADYVFVDTTGEEVRAPIRDRFEIAVIPTAWGQLPLLAKPDMKDGLVPREQGPWGQAGIRQTEAQQASARSFYLWYWTNPHPDRELAAVRVEPRGPRFYIGGITLSQCAEPPLVRAARRPVKITLTKPKDAQRRGHLTIEVDRGTATYPHALPERSADQFLADDFRGWGEAQNPQVSPSYTEIAANPSATVTIKHGEEVLGRTNWGELEEKGAVEAENRVRIEVVDAGRNWVKTTVVDDETGRPVPCRIHFRSPEGVPYQPHGHHHHVNSHMGTWHMDVGGDVRLGQITYAYIDGKCEGWLPRGEMIVDVARGYEYEPIRTRVTIGPGQQELTLRLKRIVNMNAERYFSGDTHVHFLSSQGAHLESAAEGLNVVNLLQSQWGHLFTNTEEFTGRPSVAPNGETIVYVTQENRQHLLGHLTLLGLKQPVNPWCSDGPSEAELGGNLETTLARWADACHAQGGTVVAPHFPNPNGESAALIATGRADAVEWLVHNQYMHEEYYRYLNCGYRLPLTGGTDKMTSDVPVGIYRTYVHIPDDEPFAYDTWCKYLKRGNTFISGGPLLKFQVEGQPIGSIIQIPPGGGTVELEASARSVLPVQSLEIVMNGKVIERVEESGGARHLALRARVRVDRHSWLAARCGGPQYSAVKHHDGWRRGIMAHTSPVYLSVGGEWWMFDPGAAHYMLTLINGCIDYIRTRSPQWRPGTVTHHHGPHDHLEWLEQPFREAIEAVHRRMHELGLPH